MPKSAATSRLHFTPTFASLLAANNSPNGPDNTHRKPFIHLQHQQSSFAALCTPASRQHHPPIRKNSPPPFEQIFAHSDSFSSTVCQPNGAATLTSNNSCINIAQLGRARTNSRKPNEDAVEEFDIRTRTSSANHEALQIEQQQLLRSADDKVALAKHIANAQEQLRLQRKAVVAPQQYSEDVDFAEQEQRTRARESVQIQPVNSFNSPATNSDVQLAPLASTAANGCASVIKRSIGLSLLVGSNNAETDNYVKARLYNSYQQQYNNDGTGTPRRRSSGNSSSTTPNRKKWKWMFHLFSYFGALIGQQEWIFLILLGVLTAALSFSVDIIIDQVLRARLTQVDKLQNRMLKLAVWMGPSILFIMASTAVTLNLAPQAIGSGIAHLKTILHGVVLKEYLSLRTLWVKVIGLTLALCSGLPIGKVGPFVHIGAIMARQLGRVREYLISDWRTKTALPGMASRKYDTVSAGCAVGLASCDASPVGGVLFAIEVTSTYFAIQNYWRGFLAALSAALTFRLLSVWSQDQLTLLPLFTTKFPIEFPFDLTELSLFVLLGAVCGVLGAMYVKLHRTVSLLHRRVPRKHKIKFAYIFPLVFAIGYTLITFPDGYGNYFVGRLWLRRAAIEFLYDSHAGIAHKMNALAGAGVSTTADGNGEAATIGESADNIDSYNSNGGEGIAAYGTARAQHYSSVYSPTLGMFLTSYTIHNNPYNPNNLKKHGDYDDDDDDEDDDNDDDDVKEESALQRSPKRGHHHVQALSTKDGINFESVYDTTAHAKAGESEGKKVNVASTRNSLAQPDSALEEDLTWLSPDSSTEKTNDLTAVTVATSFPTFDGSTPFDDIRYHIEKFQPGSSVILILCNYCLLHFFCTPISATLPVPTGTFVPSMVLGAGFGRLVGEVVKVLIPDGFVGYHRDPIAATQAVGDNNQSRINESFSQPFLLHTHRPILPGAYSVVGAAAFLAAVTQTISPAIIAVEMTGQVGHVIPLLLAVLVATSCAKRLEVSIYESIINLLRLPYVPHLDASNEAVHRTTVADIMVCDVRFVTHDCRYDDVRLLLAKTSSKITVFPLVDNKSTMVLIGAVSRSDLQASIVAKLAFRNYLSHLTSMGAVPLPGHSRIYDGKYSVPARHQAVAANAHHASIKQKLREDRPASSAANLDALPPPVSVKNIRFNVQKAQESKTHSTVANLSRATTNENTRAGADGNAVPRDTDDSFSSQHQNAVLRKPGAGRSRRSVRSASLLPNDTTFTPPQMGRASSATKLSTTHTGELMLNAQRPQTALANEKDYYKTVSSSSPTSCCVIIGGGAAASGSSSGEVGGDDSMQTGGFNTDDVLTRLAWEQQVLAEQFDFSQCKVDISPMQVAEAMPLAKVHLVFSLLRVNIVYVTSLGRLVGIATVSDLRRALQSSVR